MIAETYICGKSDGVEYGYTFKCEPGADDSEFDIALGTTSDESSIDDALAKFQPTANRIAAALSA